mmetsp:Transcript_19351/g.51311  ORF Transcript_19351/g.51311 Transcript_19351/m.51311 type:complete len:236 (-) Transcript_19351:561-1268(-)
MSLHGCSVSCGCTSSKAWCDSRIQSLGICFTATRASSPTTLMRHTLPWLRFASSIFPSVSKRPAGHGSTPAASKPSCSAAGAIRGCRPEPALPGVLLRAQLPSSMSSMPSVTAVDVLDTWRSRPWAQASPRSSSLAARPAAAPAPRSRSARPTPACRAKRGGRDFRASCRRAEAEYQKWRLRTSSTARMLPPRRAKACSQKETSCAWSTVSCHASGSLACRPRMKGRSLSSTCFM